MTMDPLVRKDIEASVRVLMDHLDKGYCVYGEYAFQTAMKDINLQY